MKNLFNRLSSKARKAKDTVRSAITNKRAEGYVDTAVKILMAVVIGALLLAGLYALFGQTILPTLTEKIKEMFNYAG